MALLADELIAVRAANRAWARKHPSPKPTKNTTKKARRHVEYERAWVKSKSFVTEVGEEIAHDPRLMDLRDAGTGERACELLRAAARGVRDAFPDDKDAVQFVAALVALGEKHRDKLRMSIIMSVVS